MADDTQAREDWEGLYPTERADILRLAAGELVCWPHQLVRAELMTLAVTPRGQRCAAYGRSLEEKR
jgi:hypothetical protein